MTELFDFMGNKVRVVVMTNETTAAKEPWFVAKDLCDCLMLKPNIKNGSYQDHYRRLPSTDRRLISVPMVFGHRNNAKVTVVTEAGLYKIVMRSNSPEAAKFQDWIARDVLPAIRKDGLSSPRWTFFTQG